MVPGISHSQSARGRVLGNLSREGQVPPIRAVWRSNRPGAFAQGPSRAMLGDQFLDQFLQNGRMPLAGHPFDHVARRVDEDQGGPGAHAVTLPDREFGVIDDRMVDLVAPDGVAKRGCLPLVGKLRRMDPNDRQGLGKPGIQRLQLREDVQAVDSAVGPEVEQDHASPEICEAERMRGVEPLHAFGKLRCVDRRAGTRCHSQPPGWVGRMKACEGRKGNGLETHDSA